MTMRRKMSVSRMPLPSFLERNAVLETRAREYVNVDIDLGYLVI